MIDQCLMGDGVVRDNFIGIRDLLTRSDRYWCRYCGGRLLIIVRTRYAIVSNAGRGG